MSLSTRLWNAHQDLAEACLRHPFVQGIGDGSLPEDRFAYYVGQDAFFLEAFARAYSIAAAKALDWEGFQVLHGLASGVLQELNLHEGYAQTWGVDLRTVTPGRATRQYTDFLLATAWSQEVGITAVAMSPCMKLYGYLGNSLAQNGLPTHRYRGWVQTYSSQGFAEPVRQLETLVEKYSQDLPLTRATYRYAMQCEYDFFQAAWAGSHA